MKERISILVDALPKYGEILLGIGSIALENSEAILDNALAREEIKKYLIEEAPKKRNLAGVSNSLEFQKILYNYIGKFAQIAILKNEDNSADKMINIYLLDFFYKKLWPIFVKKYIDGIGPGTEMVIVSINVKKNAYLTIYGEDNVDLIFNELKDFLLYNYIVICEATTQKNGDLLLKLMLPVPPHMPYQA